MTAFAVIAAAILFYMALSYLPALGNALKKLSRILSPFIWGLVFTYLLTPLMRSMPTPASPGAVAMAAIVSACIVLILSLMSNEMPPDLAAQPLSRHEKRALPRGDSPFTAVFHPLAGILDSPVSMSARLCCAQSSPRSRLQSRW